MAFGLKVIEMMYRRSKCGFTLIELVITITITLVVGATLLTTFTQGFSTVFWGGNKSKANFNIQQVVENVYADETYADPSLTSIQTDLIVNLNSSGTPDSFTIDDGTLFTSTITEGNRDETIVFFVP